MPLDHYIAPDRFGLTVNPLWLGGMICTVNALPRWLQKCCLTDMQR